MATLIQRFKSKEKFADQMGHVEVMRMEQFKDYLDGLILEDLTQERRVLLQQDGQHFTAVFIKQVDQKVMVAMADTALTVEQEWVERWMQKIVQVVKDWKLSDARLQSGRSAVSVETLAYRFNRQNDQLSCPVFCIRDIIESYRKSLIDFAVEVPAPAKERDSENENLSYIDQLPPNFMKVTQNLKYFSNYVNQYPGAAEILVNDNNQTLEQVIQSNTQMIYIENRNTENSSKLSGKLKEANFYIRKRAFKYFKIVIEELFRKTFPRA